MSDFGVLSLLPPLLAIGLALWTKKPVISLFVAIWVAGTMAHGWNPIAGAAQTGQWLADNFADGIYVACTILFIGAAEAIMYKSGGINAFVEKIKRGLRTSRIASVVASLLGIVIFVDDYINSVVVGTTMRPITDRVKVSREMLAYICDSTAAPVSGLLIASTWIGYEVGLIDEAFQSLEIEHSAYGAWVSSIPYAFYPILAIILVLVISYTHRHYGPMLKAEHRARTTGKVIRDGAKPMVTTEVDLGKPKSKGNMWVFIVPIIVLIATTFLGLWYTGGGSETYAEGGFSEILANCDSSLALVWGSLASILAAAIMVLALRQMNLGEIETAIIQGFKQMQTAIIIAMLAWSVGAACDAVGTADYVVGLATSAGVSAALVPLIVFLAAMFISFCTGTSWGTFAIMMPIAVPLAYHLSGGLGPEVFASIAAVFGGGIFGDHCSPVSDTTVLSSSFSSCDHIDHVTTQIPYAVTAAGVGVILYILFLAGLRNGFALLGLGIVLLIVFHYILSEWYGKRVDIPHGKVPVYRAEE